MRIEGQNAHSSPQRRHAETVSNSDEAQRVERGRERGERSREVAPGRRTDAAERGDRGRRAARETERHAPAEHRDRASITDEGLRRLREEREAHRPGQERPEAQRPERHAPELPGRLGRVLRRIAGQERPTAPAAERPQPERVASEETDRTPQRSRRLSRFARADLRTAPANPAPAGPVPAPPDTAAATPPPAVAEADTAAPAPAEDPLAGLARRYYTLAKNLGILPDGPPEAPAPKRIGPETQAAGPPIKLGKSPAPGPAVESKGATTERPDLQRPERVAERQAERPERNAPRPAASDHSISQQYDRFREDRA